MGLPKETKGVPEVPERVSIGFGLGADKVVRAFDDVSSVMEAWHDGGAEDGNRESCLPRGWVSQLLLSSSSSKRR